MDAELVASLLADGGIIAFAAWRIIRQDKVLDMLIAEVIRRTADEHEHELSDSPTGSPPPG